MCLLKLLLVSKIQVVYNNHNISVQPILLMPTLLIY